MISSHLRRLTPADIEALGLPDDTAVFPSLGGHRVGTSGGDAIVHVPGDHHAGLAGEHIADSYDELHNATKPNVLEARWETQDGDVERGKMSAAPDGATVLEDEIVPHAFA